MTPSGCSSPTSYRVTTRRPTSSVFAYNSLSTVTEGGNIACNSNLRHVREWTPPCPPGLHAMLQAWHSPSTCPVTKHLTTAMATMTSTTSLRRGTWKSNDHRIAGPRSLPTQDGSSSRLTPTTALAVVRKANRGPPRGSRRATKRATKRAAKTGQLLGPRRGLTKIQHTYPWGCVTLPCGLPAESQAGVVRVIPWCVLGVLSLGGGGYPHSSLHPQLPTSHSDTLTHGHRLR